MYESKLSLEEVLEQVKQRLLESPLMFYRDEAAVRQFLVEPVLRALGWNFEDGSVRSEYSLKYARMEGQTDDKHEQEKVEETRGAKPSVDYLLHEQTPWGFIPRAVIETKYKSTKIHKLRSRALLEILEILNIDTGYINKVQNNNDLIFMMSRFAITDGDTYLIYKIKGIKPLLDKDKDGRKKESESLRQLIENHKPKTLPRLVKKLRSLEEELRSLEKELRSPVNNPGQLQVTDKNKLDKLIESLLELKKQVDNLKSDKLKQLIDELYETLKSVKKAQLNQIDDNTHNNHSNKLSELISSLSKHGEEIVRDTPGLLKELRTIIKHLDSDDLNKSIAEETDVRKLLRSAIDWSVKPVTVRVAAQPLAEVAKVLKENLAPHSVAQPEQTSSPQWCTLREAATVHYAEIAGTRGRGNTFVVYLLKTGGSEEEIPATKFEDLLEKLREWAEQKKLVIPTVNQPYLKVYFDGQKWEAKSKFNQPSSKDLLLTAYEFVKELWRANPSAGIHPDAIEVLLLSSNKNEQQGNAAEAQPASAQAQDPQATQGSASSTANPQPSPAPPDPSPASESDGATKEERADDADSAQASDASAASSQPPTSAEAVG